MSERDDNAYRERDAFDQASGGDMFAGVGDAHPASNRKAARDGVMGAPPGDGSKRTALLAAGIVGGLVLAGIGAWFLGDADAPSDQEEIPVIAAPEAPYRVKPEDPGGQQIDHQDMRVYDQLSSGGQVAAQKTENLLATPSAPKPVEPVRAPEPAAMPNTTQTAPAAPVAKATPKVTDAPTPKPAAPSTTTAAAQGAYMVQLGALRSEEAAKTAVDRLVAKHAGVLGSVKTEIQRADLGERGTYYRMRIGYYGDRAAASAACAGLKAQGQDCLVVAR